jgi:hypothetical protein
MSTRKTRRSTVPNTPSDPSVSNAVSEEISSDNNNNDNNNQVNTNLTTPVSTRRSRASKAPESTQKSATKSSNNAPTTAEATPSSRRSSRHTANPATPATKRSTPPEIIDALNKTPNNPATALNNTTPASKRLKTPSSEAKTPKSPQISAEELARRDYFGHRAVDSFVADLQNYMESEIWQFSQELTVNLQKFLQNLTQNGKNNQKTGQLEDESVKKLLLDNHDNVGKKLQQKFHRSLDIFEHYAKNNVFIVPDQLILPQNSPNSTGNHLNEAAQSELDAEISALQARILRGRKFNKALHSEISELDQELANFEKNKGLFSASPSEIDKENANIKKIVALAQEIQREYHQLHEAVQSTQLSELFRASLGQIPSNANDSTVLQRLKNDQSAMPVSVDSAQNFLGKK